MTILVIGDDRSRDECREKFGNAHLYLTAKGDDDHLPESDVVFDFLAEGLTRSNAYSSVFFVNTAQKSLRRLHREGKLPDAGLSFGFAGLPTFLNRDVLEVCLQSNDQKQKLSDVCRHLETNFSVVDDRVGLVTPRVICMIINEAYYTVGEGTASRDDIDLAMKLGTSYPWGPFEWTRRIGIQHVAETLEAVYADTKDERYRISPLLNEEYLSQIQNQP